MINNLKEYKSKGYKGFEIKNGDFSSVWNAALYAELYPDYEALRIEIAKLIHDCTRLKHPKVLDSCCGSGFLSKDLYLDGFDIDFADKNPSFGSSFVSELTGAKIIKASWHEYPDTADFKKEYYDFVMCRGNSFIYSSGGINQEFKANSELATQRYIDSLSGLYSVMKPGATLYLDKYKDSEIPFKCKVGFDLETNKEIVWYCNRKIDEGYREASIGYADESISYFHCCDDLDSDLLFKVAHTVGFKIREINLKYEKNFSVYLLQK